jgi:hypothetical protein
MIDMISMGTMSIDWKNVCIDPVTAATKLIKDTNALTPEGRAGTVSAAATAKKLMHALAVVMLVGCGSARAALLYNVSFADPSGLYSDYYADIHSSVVAAGAAWDTYILGDASLEVQIGFSDSISRVTGRSVTSAFVGNDGTANIYEQGAAAEIDTGVDPNGSAPDIEFLVNPTYLTSELWFDPDPFSRTAAIATNKTDAVSVFLHEFGHAFAFNGWRNASDGTLPDNYASTFDENVVFDGSGLFFQGPHATSVFGGDVPLTSGNYGHLGNTSTTLGSELLPDLMNGVSFYQDFRYEISPLDVAILADAGLSIIPLPAAFWLFASGLLGLVMVSRRNQPAGRR